MGPSQIIFIPGTNYDLNISFARRRTVPPPPPLRPPWGTFGDAVGGWGSPPPPIFGAMRPFLSVHFNPALRGRNYPGSTSVTISLWRRFCFCRSLNHRNDWDPHAASCASHQAINHIVVDHQHRGIPQPATRYSSSRGIIVHHQFQCLETWGRHFSENFKSISRKQYSDELSSSEG